MGVSALYLHVPFCVRRCRYCDFATSATAHGDPAMGEYASMLVSLIDDASELELIGGINTAYIGGGTPTMLGAEGLATLVGAVTPLAGPEISRFARNDVAASLASPSRHPGGQAQSHLNARTPHPLSGQLTRHPEEQASCHPEEQASCHPEERSDEGSRSSLPFELTFEANPESLTDEALLAARAAGATRVSIGVQSFNDAELKGLGRVHSAALARNRVGAAVASGMDVSVDLMCGIPYQTPGSWERSLAEAVALGVGHVSCYPLMIEEGTPMERLCEAGELPWPSEDVEADGMEAAEHVLQAAGYSRYEVASYAMPGKSCRHNIAYWTGVEYLGLGMAAASMLGRASYELLRSAAPSLPEAEPGATRFRLKQLNTAPRLDGLRFEVEQLGAREAAAEDLMLGLRMSRGVSAGLLDASKEVIPASAFDAAVGKAFELGLASWYNDCLVPTERGWLMGNDLYGLFWGLASD